ncbi:ABC transporter ATP-binding protein [Mesobacillus campisalis]|uniref:Carnitine transport ATP-binding protein OpuCA n=1 Tax=Mesobacillus campisalis TaxID=1408103 RepID=A0A0M2T5C0_9BACI|nr:ABC transporter ATP-binding protein [Mesobacillus campisalis]KKK40015.1 ABC transporter ATP-binding protein [Mesobacillus campisalis]
MSYVAIKNIRKTFNDQTVLHDIELSFEKGELVTLLGPSGCGKSTLLRILAGLTRQDSGTISLDGKDITNLKPKAREIGMVFQSYALFPNMTVLENISFGLKMKKEDSQTIKNKVARMIELTGLEGKENSYPRELSGGQQQRVALARSLVMEPKVLLLDEPLSALDAQIRKKLQQQLRTIQRELKMTMVLVTHDQEEAMAISDRIFILNQGRIAQQGTPNEIYARPANEFVAGFIGNYNVLTKEELARFIPNVANWSHSIYAIRPEAFTLKKDGKSYEITGLINQVSMLGNITRYTIQNDKMTMMIDQLHQTQSTLQENESRTFFLREEDIIPIA